MDEWYCVDNIRITYAYGVLDRYNLVNDIKAIVIKIDNNRFIWQASSFASKTPYYGKGEEISKELVQQAAEKFLKGE